MHSPSVLLSQTALNAPVQLSFQKEGRILYAQCKNTFLHFSTDRDWLIENAAKLTRSASADCLTSISCSSTNDDDLSSKGLTSISTNSTNEDELSSSLTFGDSSSIEGCETPLARPLWSDQTHSDSDAEPQSPTLRKPEKAAVMHDDFTTLMIRGIPCRFTEESLLDWIDSSGFQGMYDFFYLPRFSSGGNLGYAFINLLNPFHAQSLKSMLDGVQLCPGHSEKVCKVDRARIQGLAPLQKHFRRREVKSGKRASGPLWKKRKMEGSAFKTDDEHSAPWSPDQDVVVRQPQAESSEFVDILSVLEEIDCLSQSVTVFSVEGDLPIIFSSSSFERLTGFKKMDLLGRNMRMLNQDLGLSTERRRGLNRACFQGSHFVGVLPNERKDGSTLQNLVDIRTLEMGVYEKSGQPFRLLVGVQVEVNEINSFDHGALVMPDIVSEVLQQVTSAIHKKCSSSPMLFGEEIISPLEKPFWVQSPESVLDYIFSD